jgi:hypothetical protein
VRPLIELPLPCLALALCPRSLLIRHIEIKQPLKRFEEALSSGKRSPAALLQQNVALHDPAVDASGNLPEAEYQAQLAALGAAELQKARSDWFDSPLSTELFVRMRFTSVPNSGSLDELKRFLPFFL